MEVDDDIKDEKSLCREIEAVEEAIGDYLRDPHVVKVS